MNKTLGGVAVLAASAALLTMAASAGATSACNGSSKLCSRTLDKVVLPGSHNAMSSKEFGFGIPNHQFGIPHQLTKGIRAMLIDTHYGKPRTIVFLGRPTVVIDDVSESTPGRLPYLCHVSCLSGAIPLSTGLKTVADFLKTHPREVMIFVNESYITPADFATAVTSSGLLKYVYKGSTTTYPTLSKMISTSGRVVMFSEGNTGSVAWYHEGYAGSLQETPYSFLTSNLLTSPSSLAASCVANRGGTTGKLFLMNHFITPTLTASYAADLLTTAAAVNGKATIVARANACKTARGKYPNIIAIDQTQLGDVIGAAKQLNGV